MVADGAVRERQSSEHGPIPAQKAVDPQDFSGAALFEVCADGNCQGDRQPERADAANLRPEDAG